MSYLLLMTFAGSILFALYLCWKRMLKRYITQEMKYKALIVVLLVYVVPWVWLKEMYIRIIGLFWREEAAGDAKGLVNFADIKINENTYKTEEYKYLWIFVLIWLVIAVVVMIIRVAKYLNKSHTLHSLAIECRDEEIKETTKCLQEELRYRRKPEIVWTRVDNGTFTLGAVKPIIFLQKEYVSGDLYWILKHEMFHIIRKDLLLKLLLEFVCCLHWFNPLVYFLERELEFVCETSCDERVLVGCKEQEREIYMDLLDRNQNKNAIKIALNGDLEEGSSNVDKRIKLIEEMRHMNYCEKAIATGVFLLLVILNSLTALAYPKVQHVKLEIAEAAEDSIGGGNYWSYNYVEEGYGAPVDTILYDEQFIDEAGQIYPVHVDGTNPSCLEHDIASGYYQVHNRNDDGSCTVKTYESTMCTICDMIWVGEFYSENTQMTCGH